MTGQYLHGIEIVELTTGTRPIQTVRSAVIGLIGTAPNAQADIKASTTVGTGNAAILITSKLVGVLGNQTDIRLVAPAGANAALGVVVTGNDIVVNLATGAVAGTVTSTAVQVIAAIAASPAATALVTAANAPGSTGASVVAGMAAAVFLSGGTDEPFPVNTPILIAGNQLEAAKLGSTGTLPAAIDGIFDQAGAMVVVIRVASNALPATEQANVIGGVNGATGEYEGIRAFLAAPSRLGVTPRILIAPGYTHVQAVLTEMVSVATKLRAIIVADGPNTTDAAAIAYRNLFGSDRVYLVDPWVRVFDTTTGTVVVQPASARIAGVIAKSDDERGFWHSPSNRLIDGIIGPARTIDFSVGDATSRANYLNENEVATIIQAEGFRLWGNRSCASDQKMAFLKRRRIADMISDSIQAAHLWAVDRNIDRTYVEEVIEGVNAYGRSLIARGALVGFKCWAPANLNTVADLEAGVITFDFDWSDPATAEHITFRSIINNGYLTEVLPVAA